MRPGQLARLLFALPLSLVFVGAAEAQPTFSKAFSPDTIGPGSVTSVRFTISNGSPVPATELAFTDTLPANVTIATPANVVSTCPLGPVDGSLDAPAGGSTITLTGGEIPGNSSCTISVDVTAASAGTFTNPAVTLTSNAGSSMSSPADLTVSTDRPGFSKSFSPATVPLGGRSTLTLTIDNSANDSALTSLIFSDVFPNGLEVADPDNASTTCGGPNPNLTVGTDSISFSSFGIGIPGLEVLAAGDICTVTVDVVATGFGSLDNITSELSSNAGSSGKASATLEVTRTDLAIDKDFVDDPTAPGGTAILEFVITNFDRDQTATGLGFSDDLGAALMGLTFDSVLANDCGGSVVGAGTTMLELVGGSLAPQASCTVRVSLSVPASASPGSYVNTTSAVTATVGGSPVVGNAASDPLFVSPSPVLTKTFLDDPVDPGSTVVIEFTVSNVSATSSATDIAFEDPFPVVLPTASMTPGNDCCGDGSTCTFSPLVNPPPPSDVTPATFRLMGGTLAKAGQPGDSCTFQLTLDVSDDAAGGTYTNTTSEITATVDGETRTGEPAVDELLVTTGPELIKQFIGDPVAPGGTATLRFTLSLGFEASGNATDITFTDDLDAALSGLTALLPPSPDPPCGPGSSLTGSAGDTLLTLMGGTLAPGDSCVFEVPVVVPPATAAGSYVNTTSGVMATVDGTVVATAAASDVLLVTGLEVSKEFIDDPVVAGETVTLRFTLDNSDPTNAAQDIFFTDNINQVLPGGNNLVLLTPLPISVCGGTLSRTGATLQFSNGSVPAGGPACTFDLSFQVPASTADGSYTNTTSSISATVDGDPVTLPPATAPLVVDSSLLSLTKEFIDDPVSPGGTVTLRFTLTNFDDARGASNLEFQDDLDGVLAGLAPSDTSPFSACGGTVSFFSGQLLFDSGSLLPSETCSFDVVLDVPAGAAAGDYTNVSTEITGTIDGLAVTGGEATDTLEVLDLLEFSKSISGGPATGGDTVTLNFIITNPGTAPAQNVDFFDDLDAFIPGAVATNLPLDDVCGLGSELSGSSFVTLTDATLPPMGGTCAFSVEVQLPAVIEGGVYTNETSALSSNGLEVAPPATADLTVLEADLAITKTDGVATAAPGTAVIYTIVASNDGPNDASAVSLLDDFPDILTCTYTSTADGGASGNTASGSGDLDETLVLPAGSSVTYTATCTIPSGAAGTLSNTATIEDADVGDADPSDNSATDETTLAPQSDLSVTKDDGVMTATPGLDALSYTITVSNLGPSDDPAATLVDNFPAGLDCTYTSVAMGGASGQTASGSGDLSETLSLPAGSSVTYTATCSIDSSVTGTISNTATVTASTADPVPGNNSDTDETEATPEVDLTVTKTDNVTSAVPGFDTITYTITVDNVGASDDPAATLVDTFPADLDCTYTSAATGGASGNTASGSGDLSETLSLPAGSSVTYTATCTIDPSATGTLSNTATATASVTDIEPSNNSATDDDTVLTPEADLTVSKNDGVTSAVPGQDTLTYTIVATNLGPSDDPAASVEDLFPSILDCTWTSTAQNGASGNTASGSGDFFELISLPAGSSVTYTATCSIDPGATGTVSNTATVTSSVTDPVPLNNSATDADTVLTPEADLAITKDDGVTSATPGETVTYTIVASNNGPSDDPVATVGDAFPDELTCTYTSVASGGASGNSVSGSDDLIETLSLPAGSSVVYTVICAIDPGATGTLSNTATIVASVTDPVPGNNSATDDDTVLEPVADIGIVKEGPDSVTVGTTLTYTLTVTNDGPSSAEVELDDPTPTGLTFLGADPPCAGGFPCDLGVVAAGDEVVVTVDFAVPGDYTAPIPIENTATVSTPVDDPNSSNDSSTVMTDVELDGVAPEVTAVTAAGTPLAECVTVRQAISSIDVSIEDDNSAIEGADQAANYLLVASGPDGDFTTASCAGGVAGDDVAVTIGGVSVAGEGTASVTASLAVGDGDGLEPGLYRLLVCDTITDAAGNALDGDDDGNPGGDFVVPFFRADPGNLFENGHFDDCPAQLAPWMVSTTPPNMVQTGQPGLDDAFGSPLSTSARILQTAAGATSIGQCVAVPGAGPYALSAQVRFEPTSAVLADLVARCEVFSGPACGGTSLGVFATAALLEDEGGAWVELETGFTAPAGAASALCDFATDSAAGGPAFDLYLDALFFGIDALIFADGFESGDFSAWSAAFP